ncbi:MAG: serine/threonine-protein kinase [Ideonella sp.]
MSSPSDADRCMACMKPRGGVVTCPHCGFDESASETDGHHLPLRTLLAERYLIGRVLGEGGFGITYAAWDRTLQNRRAIKEYFPDDAAHRGAEGVTVAARSRSTRGLYEEGLERFLDEARTLEKFQDEPGIVQVRDFFPANGTGYLVMGFLEGRTVKALLEEHGGRFEYAVALPLLLPVMDALQKVHDTGLLHRDISPDNLMITLSRQVRLLDFGAARSLVSERSRTLASVFKKGYTPYEQYLEDAQLGPPTDVYALAATLYRMLTGVTPPGALERRAADALLPPSAHGVVMPAAAEQALLTALAVEPAGRFPTVLAFREALVAADVAPPPLPAPAPRPDPLAGQNPSPSPPPRPILPTPTPTPAPLPAPIPAPAPPDHRWVLYGVPGAVVGVLGLIAWIGGSRTPQITAIEIPSEITVGRSASLKVSFEDGDADLDRIEFTSREGSWKLEPQDLKQRYANQTSGTVELKLTPRSAGKARIEAVVIDRGNRRSAAREFEFASVDPPASAPRLLSVQAPSIAIAGQAFGTRTAFEDADGDVRRLIVRSLSASGNFPPVELNGIQRQGQINYQITIGNPGRYRYSYQLEDARGLLSNVVEIEVNVSAAAQRPPAPTARSPSFYPPAPTPPPAPAHTPQRRPELPDPARLLDQILRGGGFKR